jgi:hyperosmotically inducible protein
MKSLIAIAVAAAFALPAAAQQTLPNEKERAKNREKVSKTAGSATLTTKVKSALAADVGMRTVTGIDVDSEDGVVTLKGKVTSADHKKRAEAVAKKVEGVKKVKNELKVEEAKKS